MSSFILLIIALVFLAFFAGMEKAFFESNKLQTEIDIKSGSFNGKLMSVLIPVPQMFLTTLLIGNIFSLVSCGYLLNSIMSPFLVHFFSSLILILCIEIIFATIIILVTVEFLSQVIFASHPNLTINRYITVVACFYLLFFPLSKFVLFLNFIFFKKKKSTLVNTISQKKIFYRTEFDLLLGDADENDLEQTNKYNLKMFRKALDFSDTKIKECMVPRTEIVATRADNSIDEAKKILIENGYSRLPVFEQSTDSFIGYIHHTDLFKNPQKINDIIRPISIVPDMMPAKKLLSQFIKEHKNIAIVVDEYGGTCGMVTMEDIIEEIFGEIEDEHDSSDMIEKQITENEFIFSGRLEIDYLNEKYNLHLPESEEYSTLAGLILKVYESIPKLQTRVQIENKLFIITKISQNRIDLVHLKIIEQND